MLLEVGVELGGGDIVDRQAIRLAVIYGGDDSFVWFHWFIVWGRWEEVKGFGK